MAPTTTDYLRGLRRLMWVPIVTLLVGIGLGLWASSGARPTIQTQGNVLYTFRVDDPGDDSSGAARGAEAGVAQSRLAGYVQLARSSQRVADILNAAQIEEPPTSLSPAGGFKDGAARALIDINPGAPGLVQVRLKNEDLNQAQADQLVDDLSREVVRQTIATDAKQVRPSLVPDALVTEPQATEEPASRTMKLALPVLLLLTLGLGIIYLLVWRQGRIYARRDIEQRLGARVLGDLGGRPADAPAIALALGKGRDAGTRALLVAASAGPTAAAAAVGQSVAAGGSELGLAVTLASVGAAQASLVRTVADGDGSAPSQSPAHSLTLIDAPAGLDAGSLGAAASVDIVALLVEYGRTSYRELTEAGQTLAEVTGAEIAVIGVDPSAMG